jgi:hypothetical protein
MTKFTLLTAVLMSLITSTAFAQTDTGSGKTWEFGLEPYLLATSIQGDASVGRVTGVPVDINFSDILETLSIAGMINFEVQHNSGWGAILDYAFMDLEADTSVGRGGVLDANVRQAIFEALITKDLGIESSTLEFTAGIRRWDNELKASFNPTVVPGSVSTKIEEDWVDLIFGIRWTRPLAERWNMQLSGDIGGFGIADGADFTWSASATVMFRISKKLVLDLGYRAIGVDYDNGKAANDGFYAYDTITHGPLVGLLIKF